MKIKNLSLSVSLVSSAIALGVGLFLIFAAESIDFISGKSGGGLGLLMQWIAYWLIYGLGVLIASAGVLLALGSIISWMLAEIYSSLSPQGKKKARWGTLILLTFIVGKFVIYEYQRSQYEALDKRAAEEQVKAEPKSVNDVAEKKEEKAIGDGAVKNIVAERLKADRALMVGKWQSEKNEQLFLAFKVDGKMKVTRNGALFASGQWSLLHQRISSSNSSTLYIDTNNKITLINDTNIGKWRNKVIMVGAKHLILEDYCENLPGSVKCEDRKTKPPINIYKRIVVIEQETK